MIRPLAGAAALLATASAAPPQAIELNQFGFLPDTAKLAILPNAGDRPVAWRLVDAQGRTVSDGISIVADADPALGYRPHRIDLSRVTKPGNGYRLVVGDSASAPFAIAPGLYRPLARDALAFFYHQRVGVPIEARFAGGARWARSAAHPDTDVPCFAGSDERGTLWDGCGYRLDARGGWYDAGDHGKYVVNGGIAAWTLLNLHEWMAGAFPDGSQPMPEAGNAVSDLLDEARVEVEWLLRMQVPDGSRQRLAVGQRDGSKPLAMTSVDTSGMAHHKLASAAWTPLPQRPERDTQPRLLYPPSTAATLNLAAVAAQCARMWRTIDPAFAARCRAAAERAWAAAIRNPEVYAVGSFTGSGGYGDSDLSDEFYWAAAELLATTGDARYRRAVAASPHFTAPVAEAAWPATAALGTATLAIVPGVLPDGEAQRLRAAIVSAARRFAAERDRSPYRIPFVADRYVWGSNAVLLNRAMLLLMAARWTGEPKLRTGAVDVLDYLLGRNPLGQSYITGYGARPMRNPHHRFWAHQLDAAFPPPPPGVVSGGPNNTAMTDDVAKKLRGTCAPQRCWADDARAYALNEVAINWNAPLVWVAAAIDDPAFAKAGAPQ